MCAGLVLPTAAWAQGAVTGLGLAPGATYTDAKGISADGTVVIGDSIASGVNQAYRWSGGSYTNLGFLPGGANTSYARAISADGAVVVGSSTSAIGEQAYRWSGGGMSGLGILAGGAFSNASGVSADGNVVVGTSGTAAGNRAYRWETGTMSSLGTLAGGTFSQANGVSGDGQIVVGNSETTGGSVYGFRWASGTMASLGTLPGGSSSSAMAISADGNVIVGSAVGPGGDQAVRWNSGSINSLGILSGGVRSAAQAVSANGSVIVGYSDSSAGVVGFRWTQATGMLTINAWLSATGVNPAGWTFSDAGGVNATGNVVVGNGLLGGISQPYIARGGDGIVGLVDLGNSLAATTQAPTQLAGLTSLALNGAHHRTLMDMPMPGQGAEKNCVWLSADYGVMRQGNSWASVAETGVCRDFSERRLRAGVGIGRSEARQTQDNNGLSRLRGEYIVGEVDWAVPGTPLVASLLGMVGRWDAGLRRGYASAATLPSTGNTKLDAVTVRARLDWVNAFSAGQVRFTPSVSYAETRSKVAAYQETDGTAPASFNAQTFTAKESRARLSAAYTWTATTELRGSVEWVHRFDSNSGRLSGTVSPLGVTLPFDVPGNPTRQDWARVGVEVDHRLSPRSLLSVSGNVSSTGQDASWSVAASYKHLF